MRVHIYEALNQYFSCLSFVLPSSSIHCVTASTRSSKAIVIFPPDLFYHFHSSLVQTAASPLYPLSYMTVLAVLYNLLCSFCLRVACLNVPTHCLCCTSCAIILFTFRYPLQLSLVSSNGSWNACVFNISVLNMLTIC
ncbi:MAG: hypothetical protein NXY57DRAFT_109874 [Lentinula lateritia]|uniref:Uncharacterized protein n=1 Tax=Lentinula lateritia TaxID=40482 RepID=A0ABQ8VKH2_9AGAR|nr:MAG: hypothetical protein NXY57DRAFT_109874 [Lentinula lateritia]KAJ4496877.1 hypothetical protein C8R41DRAFT_251462 [Lentinula lateritia]